MTPWPHQLALYAAYQDKVCMLEGLYGDGPLTHSQDFGARGRLPQLCGGCDIWVSSGPDAWVCWVMRPALPQLSDRALSAGRRAVHLSLYAVCP